MKYETVSKKEMEIIKEEFYSNFNDFEKRFFNNLDMLISRVNRLKVIEPGTLDYWTYYDVTLTQIRAMFIETPTRKSNHIVQNYLINIGQEDIAKEIDDFLDNELWAGISLREAIKVSVDKFIVHYDKVDEDAILIEHILRTKLTEPNNEYNVGNILIEFMKLLLSGTVKTWGNFYRNT